MISKVSASKRAVGRVATIFALALFTATFFTTRSTNAEAQGLSYGSTCVSYIPQAWGEFKGGSSQSGLAFQDSKGTIRFVTNATCDGTPVPALEIRRTATNPSN
jgi:hypothetical protein